MLRDMLPGDTGASAALALLGFVPPPPFADAGEGDERGETLVAGGISCDERGRMAVDLDLRADDRSNGPLTDRAVAFAQPLVRSDLRASGILRRRHRFDAELR